MIGALKKLTLKSALINLLGSAILAFGLYNIHAQSPVTEGGVLGLTLLIHHHFGISPAVSGFIVDFACYAFGFFVLGGGFLVSSAIAGGGFSLFYALFERLPPVWPRIGEHPLAAALVGALFVGVGVGLSVRNGGAPGGDDALAMSVTKLLPKIKIEWFYLASDAVVLLLSLTYIPLIKIAYSLLTVVLSGQIIGFVQRVKAADVS